MWVQITITIIDNWEISNAIIYLVYILTIINYTFILEYVHSLVRGELLVASGCM